jgi:hypothetical protein
VRPPNLIRNTGKQDKVARKMIRSGQDLATRKWLAAGS